MEDLGIVYGDEMDLSLDDIDQFIQQVKDMGNVKDIRVMGGEPTVHPLFEEICLKLKSGLMDTGSIKGEAYVVTNGLVKRDSCLRPFIQVPMAIRPLVHTCALVAPKDLKIPFRTDVCPTPWMWGISFNKLGWYPCGPGGAIARLFKLEHIRKNSIVSADDWKDSIFDVCSRCQNYAMERLTEINHGRLITESYQKAIDAYVS